MKAFGRVLTLVLSFVVYFGTASSAQVSTRVIKVRIPFEFNVGDKSFPAGDYSVCQPMQHFLELRDSRGQTVASVVTHGVDARQASATPKLRFQLDDGQYTLSEVWRPYDGTGEQLSVKKTAVMLAKRHSAESREAAEGSQP